MRKYSRLTWILVLVLLALLLGRGSVQLVESTAPPSSPFPHGRMGIGRTARATRAMMEYLNIGWYWDWAALGASQFDGIEYAQTIRLRPVLQDGIQIGYTARPTGTRLLDAIAAQPGAMWIIGNEPDCTAMDNMISHWYAYAYHDLYHLIKAADPTAQIVAGNIVQPTRQRFDYLDRVLTAYKEAYGEPLPADIWATHNYILCEKCYPFRAPGEPFAWGACWVPDWPSYSQSQDRATFYSVYDHWDTEIYGQRIIDFRQWMADNGYRNHPLLIPEYGILFYEGLVSGMKIQDDIDFMYDTFDWMLTARDPVLGYAPDDNRLTQRWAWFSLDHGNFPGGSLFRSGVPTAHGFAFHEYAHQLQPQVTLHAIHAKLTTPTAPPGTPVTATVTFTASNSGNVPVDYPLTALLYAQRGARVPIAGVDLPRDLGCCGDHEIITLTWPNYVTGTHENFDATGSHHESFYVTVTQPIEVSRVWAPTVYPPGEELVTHTLYATVSNYGSVETGTPITLTFYDTSEAEDSVIGETQIPELDCCGASGTGSVLWPGHEATVHMLQRFCVVASTPYMQSDPVCGFAWISPHQFFLPLVMRQAP